MIRGFAMENGSGCRSVFRSFTLRSRSLPPSRARTRSFSPSLSFSFFLSRPAHKPSAWLNNCGGKAILCTLILAFVSLLVPLYLGGLAVSFPSFPVFRHLNFRLSPRPVRALIVSRPDATRWHGWITSPRAMSRLAQGLCRPLSTRLRYQSLRWPI